MRGESERERTCLKSFEDVRESLRMESLVCTRGCSTRVSDIAKSKLQPQIPDRYAPTLALDTRDERTGR